MATKWDVYSRQCIDLASTALSLGFSTVKLGTRLGFRIARSITDTTVGITTTVIDHALFGGGTVTRPVAGAAVHSVFTLAEQLALAPIHLSEYITSTSLIAAHSSINVLSVIFPGSSEASFSLVSFITLVRREWSERDSSLPKKRHGLTHIARAIVAWVALQGVTQEWQEERWFQHLKELDVKEKVKNEAGQPVARPRRNSRVRVTSDVIFPGQGGPQIISADIGEAPASDGLVSRSRNSTLSSLSSLAMTSRHSYTSSSPILSRAPSFQHPPQFISHQNPHTISHLDPSYSHSNQQSAYPFPSPESFPLPLDELKSTLRRLSKMVLAGYGGASLLFFGVTPYEKSSDETSEKSEEEAKLTDAVDAAEAEAAGVAADPSSSNIKYTWWDQLLGKHDREIFERTVQNGEEDRNRAKKEKERRDKMKATAIVGTEHLMPRFWVLTDHGRGQIVLVIRGTMSLNEIAVDLTCETEGFQPAHTQDPYPDDDPQHHIPGVFIPSRSKDGDQDSQQKRQNPQYHVHSGMLRMARAMGDVGKPVQLAVHEALYHNPGFDLVLCGHSLGAGVAALLGLMWADPMTCLTVRSSGLPVGRRVYAYCFAPPALGDINLSRLAKRLVVSFVYSHDVVARLSLASVRNIRNAVSWLCEAEEEKLAYGRNSGKLGGDGWSAVTDRAKLWKEGRGGEGDMDWFIAVRKTLEANMQDQNMFPPGRVLWAMRDSDLHVSHQKNEDPQVDRLRIFEVLDVEKVFGQIIFARNMLTAHLPNQYDRVLHDLL